MQAAKIDVRAEGKLSFAIPHGITFEQKTGVDRQAATEEHRALHGSLARCRQRPCMACLGFKKELDIGASVIARQLKARRFPSRWAVAPRLTFSDSGRHQVAVESRRTSS